MGARVTAPEELQVRRTGRGRFQLSLPGEAVCDIDLGRADVVVHAVDGTASAALGHLVADHVLPRVAGERMYCLHAAAVAVDGLAYVLAGSSGAGKSTLALRLARDGGLLLSDDCAAITGGRVRPTYRASRVWPASLTPLGLSDLATDASGKVTLHEGDGVRIAGSPVPLAGIVLVGVRARRLGLDEAFQLVLGQRFHLGGRLPRALFDDALALLNRWGPIHEVDRHTWRPPGRERTRHDGS